MSAIPQLSAGPIRDDERSAHRGLLALRTVWLAVFALIVGLYTVGLPLRIDALFTVLPSGGPWSALTLAEAAALAAWGVPLPAYFWAILLAELLLAGASLALGALIVWRRPANPGAIVTALLIISLGCSESDYTRALADYHPLLRGVHLGLQALATYLGLIIFYLFPDGRFVPRWARWLALAYGLLFLLWLSFPAVPFNPLPFGNYNRTPVASTLFYLSWQATGVAAMALRYLQQSTPVQRQQMKWAVFGLLLGLGASISFYIGRWAVRDRVLGGLPEARFAYEALSNLGYMLTLGLIAGCFAVAVLRHRLWDVEVLIRRTLLYAALSLMLALVALASVLVGQRLLRGVAGLDGELTSALTTLLLVLLFGPLYRRLQALIDGVFDRVQVGAQATLTAFTRELQQRQDAAPAELLRTLLQRSVEALKIAHGAIYLRDDDGAFRPAERLHPPPELPAALDAQLAEQLRAEGELHRPRDPVLPLLIPLAAFRDGERVVIGALALGPRRSEEPYRHDAVELLRAFVDRTGIAITVAEHVAYQLSPAGRAAALARALAGAPTAALAGLHRLAQRALMDGEQAAILAALPDALQRAAAPALAELAGGYRLVVESHGDDRLLAAGLRALAEAGGDRAGPSPYRLCLIALEARSLAELGVLVPLVGAPEPAEPVPAPISSALSHVRAVLSTLDALPRLGTEASRLAGLRQAEAQLEGIEALLGADLDLVSRRVAGQIIRHWRALVEGELRTLRGQARVELRLITGSVVAAPVVTLALELINRGAGAARQIVVAIEPGPGCTADEPAWRLAELPGGEARQVAFTLRRRAGDLLRPTLTLSYADAAGQRILQPQIVPVAVLTAPRWAGPLLNPYVAGSPLSPASPLFMGRERDIEAVARAVAGRQPTALMLTGQHRTGKTSLLKQLGARLGDRVAAVYLDGQGLAMTPELPALLGRIAAKTAAALGAPPGAPPGSPAEPVSHFAEEVLPRALAAAGPRKLLLIIDEIEALEQRCAQGRLDPAFFGYLRHLMQHEPRLALVVAGVDARDELRQTPWAGAFTAALHHRLGCLDERDARRLIVTPAGEQLRYDDLAVDQLLGLSGGHPYFLQLLCLTLVDLVNEREQTVVTVEHVLAARGRALEAGQMVLESLWRDSPPEEQAVLVGLSKVLPPGATRSAEQISAALLAGGAALGRRPIAAALERLARRDILAALDDPFESGGRRYHWRLGLLSAWLRQLAMVGDPL